MGGDVFSGLGADAFGVILGGGRAFVFLLSRVPNGPSKTGLDQLVWSKVMSSPMVEIRPTGWSGPVGPARQAIGYARSFDMISIPFCILLFLSQYITFK